LAALQRVVLDGVPALRFQHLERAGGIVHGVFTREGGTSRGPWATLNVSASVGDNPEHVRANRARIAAALGFPPDAVVTTQQVHGDRPIAAEEVNRTGDALEGDILAIGRPGWLLLMKFADCVPLVLWDPRRGCGALAHAGWRGTALGVVARAVRFLATRYGSNPDDILVGIGPAIGPCCYEVSDEVAAAVERAVADVARDNGKPSPSLVLTRRGGPRPFLDLAEANRLQLVLAGVPPDHVALARICTACHADRFFSHRASGGRTGRFAVVLGVAA
jgi:YfiH family protein